VLGGLLFDGDDGDGGVNRGLVAGTKDTEVVGLAFAQQGVTKLGESEGCVRFVIEAGDDVILEKAILLRG
jgi:FlaG/FlaF family flagellin (archaellin)